MVARLSEMSGLKVFTEDGRQIGLLEDISVDPETGKVLGMMLKEVKDDFLKKLGAESTKGLIVPYGAVKSVGDIILMRNISYEQRQEEEL